MPCVRPEGIMSAPYQSPKQNKRRIAKDVQLSSFSIRNYGLTLLQVTLTIVLAVDLNSFSLDSCTVLQPRFETKLCVYNY